MDRIGDCASIVLPPGGLRCESGALIDAEISNAMAFPPQPEWMIAGTRGGLVSDPNGIRGKWFDPAAALAIAMQDGPAAGRSYGAPETLPWQEEVVPLPRTCGFVVFYDNVAGAIRAGVRLAITPESVRDTTAVLETCRKQNPGIWGSL